MKSAPQEMVAEIEGEYGPLTIPESLVQKIWARGDFKRAGIQTLEGADLEILDTGRWNLLAGPDFQGISLRINGELLQGDAELHFFDKDWEAHGHGRDPAYGKVILHILVFPPKELRKPSKAPAPHSLLLLDLLPQSLETYAEEEALGALTPGRSDLELELLAQPWKKRIGLLGKAARKRWEGKVRYAGNRLDSLGWEEACHQTAMEILGYRYNRAVMLFLGADYSLKALKSGKYGWEELFEAGGGRWRLSGIRPANHPKLRLRQYLDWIGRRPDWPRRLKSVLPPLSSGRTEPLHTLTRKTLGIPDLKKVISESILAHTVGGTRIENLVCDGFLPLLAAAGRGDPFACWYCWYPGDLPGKWRLILRKVLTGGERSSPVSNGHVQGLLQLSLEKQAFY